MKQTILLLIAICIAFSAFGQERESIRERKERVRLENKKPNSLTRKPLTIYREFGFNMASILQSVPILPLGRSGFPNHVFFYKRKKSNKNRLFRFHVAGSVGGFELSVTSFEMKFGLEYNRTLAKGWEYYYGYDFLVFFQTSEVGIGAGPIFGMKYKINDFITIGSEGSAYFTLSEGGSTINMRPLNGIFISYKLFK